MMTYNDMVFIKATRDDMHFMWYIIDDKCHTVKIDACLSLAYISPSRKVKDIALHKSDPCPDL